MTVLDTETEFHDVAGRDEVAPDKPIRVAVGRLRIGLYDLDGEIFAIEDICPHGYASLVTGFIEDGLTVCPIHYAQYDIRTGKAANGTIYRDLVKYDVRVENGRILVEVPSAAFQPDPRARPKGPPQP